MNLKFLSMNLKDLPLGKGTRKASEPIQSLSLVGDYHPCPVIMESTEPLSTMHRELNSVNFNFLICLESWYTIYCDYHKEKWNKPQESFMKISNAMEMQNAGYHIILVLEVTNINLKSCQS